MLPGPPWTGPALNLRYRPMEDETEAELRARLVALQTEHRDLDDIIGRLSDATPFDQLQLVRLKKRKLLLKDEIIRLQSRLLPDIIA